MKTQIFVILTMMMMMMMILGMSEEEDENLMERTCKNTPNYGLCMSVLRASPGSATADVTGLSLIMVAAVKAKAEEAITAVNSLMKSGQPKLSPALRECGRVYDAVVKADVAVAEEALRKGDPKFADTGMADAAVEAELCDAAFKGVVAPSPLSPANKALRDTALVARAIITNLL